MKTKTILYSLTLIILTCGSCNQKKEQTKEAAVTTQNEVSQESTEDDLIDDNGDPILIGVQKRASLEAAPYDRWFKDSYTQHTLDTATVAAIAKPLAETNITLYMGTWCEDSQRETPALYKILDLAGIDANTVKLITVSEDKDTPDGLQKGMNITNVPTIILSQNNKEIGRIVEYPIESLEKDLAKILSGEEYKHAYEE